METKWCSCCVSPGATRAAIGFLYGVTPTDLPTFVGMSVVLLLVAAGAAYGPARRAARTDPVVALRDS